MSGPADHDLVPQLELSHGQALWVLAHIGFRTGDTETAFNAYIKGLRRAGLPFAENELGVGTGHNAIYRYDHLMELAVALALRAQAILPRDVVGVLTRYRKELRAIYRRAYLEREAGLGELVRVRIDGHRNLRVSGVYLDLGLAYQTTGFLFHYVPRALGPAKAIETFTAAHLGQRMRGLMPLSHLAVEIVRLASDPPELRRGRP